MLLFGLLLVAGVDAQEYGALLHTLLLVGLKLVLQFAAESSMLRVVVADERETSSMTLLSQAAAVAFAAVLGVMTPASSVMAQRVANDRASEDGGIMGLSTWTFYMAVAVGCQSAAVHFQMKERDLSSTARAKAQGVSSAAGMLLAVIVTAWEGAWLRCILDVAACAVILYVLTARWRNAGGPSEANSDGEGYLDTYRSSVAGSSDKSGMLSGAMHVLGVLWSKRASRQLLLFLSANIAFMFVELGVGLYTNSLGLMGDAGHMLFDNGALVIGLAASYIGQLPPDAKFTYGYGRVEVLSGFLNSLLLLVVSFHLLTEAASRFMDPPEVSTDHLLLTSTVGLLVNLVGLFCFHDHVHGHGHSHGGDAGHSGVCGSGHGHSHGNSPHQSHGEDASEGGGHGENSNMYGVYLHVLADTLGSVGVIISSVLIEMYEWHVADSASSALISLLILGSTLPLLRDTARQLLQGAPQELEGKVNAALRDCSQMFMLRRTINFPAMQSKKTDDRLYLRSLSDASSSPLLVDTRASQSLQPIHLPAKLRGRIERAQRRANAAKDGVSIFATDSKNSMASSPAAAVNGRSSTAPVADGAVALTLGDTEERSRASTAMGNPGLNVSAEKMHLPDVVLSHKMRDFEARANTGGIAALLPAEPADRTLQKLPLEDRERVMLVMQSKIRQIASDVEANFARIAKTLDANGIFDASANIQRAQTLCLVDLQRRCKLDRLRDEAMREILQLLTAGNGMNNKISNTINGNSAEADMEHARVLDPVDDSPVDAIVEETEEYSESKDRFDAEGHDHGDGEDNHEDDEEGEDEIEGGDDDLESIDSGHPPFSARSSISMSSVKQRVSNGNKKRGKKRVPTVGLRRSSRGSSRSLHAGTALPGNALPLHARLEVVWRVLQFPFSHKLAMSERLSSLQDADAFLSALEHWERVTPLVAIRQRMKLALSGFAERGKLQENEWLTPSEFALIHDHFDAVTLQTQKLAHELKVNTGEELQFQGYPYPRRV
ncbi:hypothetical protein BBO99_00007781 [Phytophthora kernoviae]|uniref:Cation efflux protein transmembrane domain-containing protein n=2 Tax=Phytophthora kernoviae TaxID=325452 RepID=A0A3R7JQH1_9STRA|nr:hypothetical protein G195_006173 [Phytophthora kernoviae 00238/432]KAG2515883.1 hypothetical protein JM18_007422 [Phytophthora kernoviae]KAG2518206.1 hypothetical protein JM16_005406 [Phytophthora kernoviae]RLN76128.1 hypothetical protein BBO99_00007781 [Phytophthora kernoviae]